MDAEDFKKEPFLKELGRHIAKVRKSKGYSQDRVCLEAGLSRGALSKIESGRVEPKISTLALIAITIEVPLAKLTGVDVSQF
jgi:transcriptional regulator with XRE-family HTH domain